MPEKWDQVKELFTLALERDAAERSEFLRRACGDDDSLRTEIESLLSSFDGAPTFLEDSPAANLLIRAVARHGGKTDWRVPHPARDWAWRHGGRLFG